ncbi:tobH protein [Rhodococcus sp. IEGM 1379]|uniref:tobH protein n=1 Tax=Rhodococcus sp. IEGM 1379 TaxID=3047086 RepID=UPI0024B7CDD1|nr:tobH protein [Rhodococcus sp. IEGM 1379]MDI9914838.1 tobH protein [Rhodococcus sp. IEGM 1379]
MTAPTPLLDLDDSDGLSAADFEGLLRSVAMGGAQIRSTASAIAEGTLDRLVGLRPRSIVLVAGAGGARHAARIAVALLGNSVSCPLVLLDRTPSWVGPLDVVVVAGDDAGDPRLVESVDGGVRRGAEVVVAVPEEGPMRAAAAGRTMSLAPRVFTAPRHTMMRFLAVFAAVVAAIDNRGRSADGTSYLGRSADGTSFLDRIADAVDAEAISDGPTNEVFHNPAKSLATRMRDHRVVLCGSGALASALAEYASASLLASGHSAAGAELSDVIAAARSLFVPTGGARDSVFHDPFFHDPEFDGALPVDPVRVFVFAMEAGRGEATRRIDALADADLVIAAHDDTADTGVSEMEQLFVLASRLDMASAYVQLTGGAR